MKGVDFAPQCRTCFVKMSCVVTPPQNASLRSIINNVLNVFRPKRWVLTMVADKAGLNTITENPFNVEQVRSLSFTAIP